MTDSDQTTELPVTHQKILDILRDANGSTVSYHDVASRVPTLAWYSVPGYIWTIRRHLATIGSQEKIETVGGQRYRIMKV